MDRLPLDLVESPTGSSIAVVTLDAGERPVVVLDADLIARLAATLDALPANLAGLVLASGSPRSFVAGADLKTIVEKNDADLHAYLEEAAAVFAQLSQLPFPTAAAIAGAVLGGGLELAMHCDLLVGAPSASGKPYPVGLPEAGLAICPGWGGTNLLPARIDPARAIEMTASGTTMNETQAKDAGLFDAWAESAENVVEVAVALVAEQPPVMRDGAPSRWIGRHGTLEAVRAASERAADITCATQAAAAVHDAVRVGLDRGWDKACAAERAHLVQLRHTPEAKSAIEAFFERNRK
ncbi:MAG: enoyl-CoA hydratase/isomerase family protein [Phycisphaeraceae bacterium]|nr:enoyl-CoA hydratase/isomerase family protein [Phycisphaeraceae bacterium]